MVGLAKARPNNDNDNDSALQHNSKYNNNNDHNSEVNVYCIEGLPATCAGWQPTEKLISYRAELQNKNKLIIKSKNY